MYVQSDLYSLLTLLAGLAIYGIYRLFVAWRDDKPWSFRTTHWQRPSTSTYRNPVRRRLILVTPQHHHTEHEPYSLESVIQRLFPAPHPSDQDQLEVAVAASLQEAQAAHHIIASKPHSQYQQKLNSIRQQAIKIIKAVWAPVCPEINKLPPEKALEFHALWVEKATQASTIYVKELTDQAVSHLDKGYVAGVRACWRDAHPAISRMSVKDAYQLHLQHAGLQAPCPIVVVGDVFFGHINVITQHATSVPVLVDSKTPEDFSCLWTQVVERQQSGQAYSCNYTIHPDTVSKPTINITLDTTTLTRLAQGARYAYQHLSATNTSSHTTMQR